jgi:hypothetical protein
LITNQIYYSSKLRVTPIIWYMNLTYI